MAIERITNVDKCCGCSICSTICPTHSIKMEYNNEGFLYPVIDPEKCIECRLCIKKCPINSKPIPFEQTYKSTAFACENKNDKILEKSSSGGFFYEISKLVLDKGGVVFGAAFMFDQEVKHVKVETIDSLEMLMGSKYVQSVKENIWEDVKKELLTQRLVLFSGTPCEVGALMNFLGKSYENLLSIDFICMGVPSPLVYKKHLRELKSKYKSEIKFLTFRTKKYGAFTHSLYVKFQNNRKYFRTQFAEPYVKGFHARLFLRSSCHSCSFKQEHRVSDITMADFWGLNRTNIPLNREKGVSMIIVQSSKGKAFFNLIKSNFKCFSTDMETVKNFQLMYTKSCDPSPHRASFFSDMNQLKDEKLDEIIKRYCPIKFKDLFRSKLKQYKILRVLQKQIKGYE